ncbi:hypothetical protein ACFX2I_005614 [Malus domestica]
MEQMVSEKQITLRSSSTGPGGPGLPLEDDVVLIVGHFGDSSEQRIRFPSSDDCLWQREFRKSGRSWRRICQASECKRCKTRSKKRTKASISTCCCNTQLRSQIGGKQFSGTSSSNWVVVVFFLHL